MTHTTWKSWLSGVLAYLLWGILPLYWRHLSDVPAAVVLAHRIIWSAVSLIIFLAVLKRIRTLLVSKWDFIRYASGATLLSINWGLYIWAVVNQRLLASSLGYFLAPIFYCAAGKFFFKEELSKPKLIALFFGMLGIVPLLINSDLLTALLALGLSVTFVLYACLRKGGTLVQSSALTLESLLVAPAALIFLLSFGEQKIFPSSTDMQTTLLLIGAGPVTLIPLVFFGRAVKELSLHQIGFLQYLSPSIQFLIAVYILAEPIDSSRWISFALVWFGIFALTLAQTRLMEAFMSSLRNLRTRAFSLRGE